MLYLGVGVDHDALVKLAEQHFSGLRSTYESQDVLQPCRYTGSEVSTLHHLHVAHQKEKCVMTRLTLGTNNSIIENYTVSYLNKI